MILQAQFFQAQFFGAAARRSGRLTSSGTYVRRRVFGKSCLVREGVFVIVVRKKDQCCKLRT